MRNRLKDLLELTSIELAYARAEIAITGRDCDEKARIVSHMKSAAANLRALIQIVDEFETGAGKLGDQGGRQSKAKRQTFA
jgi:hypothetical protein